MKGNPIVIEQISSQGNYGSGVGPAPTHAAFFHATGNDQSHSSLDHAAAHQVALLFSPAKEETNFVLPVSRVSGTWDTVRVVKTRGS